MTAFGVISKRYKGFADDKVKAPFMLKITKHTAGLVIGVQAVKAHNSNILQTSVFIRYICSSLWSGGKLKPKFSNKVLSSSVKFDHVFKQQALVVQLEDDLIQQQGNAAAFIKNTVYDKYKYINRVFGHQQVGEGRHLRCY